MAQVRTAKRETELYGCCRCTRYMKIDLDLLGFSLSGFPGDSRALSPKLTQALRSQTRSGSGTQNKLKIFEDSCPRQLLMLACTGQHLQCLFVLGGLHDKDEDGKQRDIDVAHSRPFLATLK